MKYYFTRTFSLSALVIVSFCLIWVWVTPIAYGALPTNTPTPLPTATPTPDVQPTVSPTPVEAQTAEGDWIPDADVTFFGKTAARSADFLNWTLTNYKWAYNDSSLSSFWVNIRNIIYSLLVLSIVIEAFLLIISGGNNVGTFVFLKKFLYVVILITFSFAIIRLFYQIFDITQGFFIHKADGTIISSKDLLNMSFGYADFAGFRRIGVQFDESAYMSLLLVKLTAVTYYVMSAILLVRKVLLWFFLIISPLYPLLLLFSQVRNTAKIWVREFFRWLLYAPLFVIFLSSLVTIWKNDLLVLPFKFGSGLVVYPTAISILLGGPGQKLSITNSINYTDTFAQYLIALIMLWVVIILPFILLQIFFDYVSHMNVGKEDVTNYISKIKNNMSQNFPFMRSGTPPAPLPANQGPTGAARALAKAGSSTIRTVTDVTRSSDSSIYSVNTNTTRSSLRAPAQQIGSITNKQVNETTRTEKYASPQRAPIIRSSSQTQNIPEQGRQTAMVSSRLLAHMQTTANLKHEMLGKNSLRLVSFPIPTMRDIVKFETIKLSNNKAQDHEIEQVHQTLEKIAEPQTLQSETERQQYMQLKENLTNETQKGDILAKSILSAADLTKHSHEEMQKQPQLPVINQVQTVSLDDYEAVRELWEENYANVDVPESLTHLSQSRDAWIEEDVQKISQTITLLTSQDHLSVQQGLSNVSSILPFLLIGGFSNTEAIAYLKAKLEAGKSVLSKLTKENDEQNTLLNTGKAKEENKLEISDEESVDVAEKKSDSY